MKTTFLKVSAIALAVSAAMPALAETVTINFDNVAAGASANSALPLNAGFAFYNAVFTPDVDAYGDAIIGSEKWRIDTDPSTPAVDVVNTVAQGYGAAPSGTNALNGLWQPVLVHFDHATDLNGFSVTLDNSAYGNLSPSQLLFLDAGGNTLAQIILDQTQPGAIGALNSTLFGVQDIVLASGALYDNVTVSSVPLPAAAWLMFSALGGLGTIARRKRAS
jgi:hypothetical protein